MLLIVDNAANHIRYCDGRKTTAKIQDECNKYQWACLVSGTLMNRLKQINGFEWERMDAVTLRGKETEVELFSVINAHPGYAALAV